MFLWVCLISILDQILPGSDSTWIKSYLDQTLPGSDSTWNIWRYSSGCPTGIIIREVNIRWTQRKENVGGHPCTFIQVYIEEKTWRVQFFITSCFLSPIHTPYPSRVYSTQFNISSAELTQYLALQMAGSYDCTLIYWTLKWFKERWRNLWSHYFISYTGMQIIWTNMLSKLQMRPGLCNVTPWEPDAGRGPVMDSMN